MTADKLPTLLGAEMVTWSDLQGVGAAPGVATPVLDLLLPDAESVLIAGPCPDWPSRVAGCATARLDVLLRSLPDAERAAREAQGASVFCGPLSRYKPDRTYDLVLSTSGLASLSSLEEDPVAWTDSLEALCELVAAHGVLILLVDNPVGVDAQLEGSSADGNSSWPVGCGPEATPESVDAVVAAAGRLGFEVDARWLMFGPRSRLTTAVDSRAVHSADAVAQQLAAEAWRSSPYDPPDGRGLRAEQMLESGHAAAAASASVLCLVRPTDVRTARPELLVHGARLYSRSSDGENWCDEEGAAVPGDTVARRLRRLLRAHDEAGASALVRRVFQHLGDHPAGAILFDRLACNTKGDLLVTVAPSDDAVLDRDAVIARAVLRFALAHISSADPRLPAVAPTPFAAARSLLSAVGLELDDELVARAVHLDLRVEGCGGMAAALSRPESDHALRTATRSQLLSLNADLARELEDQRAHVLWLLGAIQTRQRNNARLRREIARLRRSPAFVLARKARAVRSRLRGNSDGGVGRWRPPPEAPPQEAGDPAEPKQLVVDENLLPPGLDPPPGVRVVRHEDSRLGQGRGRQSG